MSNSIESNAYRILGLDVTASQKDILKRYKEIINRLKIDDYPEYELDLRLPKKLRNEATVTDALKRLQSQKSNLNEYFFWLQIADKTDEKAVKYLQTNEISNAIQTWKNGAKTNNSTSYFYKKNLTLLYGLLLLEENNPTYLSDSLTLWHEIVSSDKFWTAFSKVYSANNEQTISSNLLLEFKKNATKQISDIYTDLFKHHKDNKYIKSVQEIFGTHGEKTEKTLLNPVYQSTYDKIKDLEEIQIEEKGEVTDATIRSINKLVDSIKIELNKLKDIGAYDDAQSKVVRDHAVDAIRFIAVRLHNHTDQWGEATKLLKIALEICGTESSRDNLSEEIKQIKKNYHIHCWFCKTPLNGKKDEEAAVHEDWHKITDRFENIFGSTTSVQYQKFELVTPRCQKCESAHNRREWVTALYGSAGIAAGGGALYLLWDKGNLAWLVALSLAVLVYVLLKKIDVGGLKKFSSIKAESYRKEYPVYKQLEAQGWRRGREPSL